MKRAGSEVSERKDVRSWLERTRGSSTSPPRYSWRSRLRAATKELSMFLRVLLEGREGSLWSAGGGRGGEGRGGEGGRWGRGGEGEG